jgi:4-diphosphocytidyl-2-C-methyl-D-erythritol kinase
VITTEAPAKVNLSLRVAAVDRSGFHRLHSRVQMIDWHDYLAIEWWEEDLLEITGLPTPPEGRVDVPTGKDNLVWKAAAAFWADDPGSRRPVRVTLEKCIPVAAGLAGGSADAAAMAAGLAALTGRPYNLGRLVEVGSDIVFSVAGGSALMEGYGETLAPVPMPDDFALVLAVPPIELSTPGVYQRWDDLDGPAGVPLAGRAVPPSLRGMEVVNDLYPAAVSLAPDLADYRSQLISTWDRPVAMSGSGPTLFAFFSDLEEATGAASVASGMRAIRATIPVDHGARVRPQERDYNDPVRR